MKRFLPAVCLVALVGCSMTPRTVPAGVDVGPQPTQEQIEAAARQYPMIASLKDPYAAQVQGAYLIGKGGFRNGLAGIAAGQPSVYWGWLIGFDCNMKNGFGAYMGFKHREVLLLPGGRVLARPEFLQPNN